jgi:hypothetical protein
MVRRISDTVFRAWVVCWRWDVDAVSRADRRECSQKTMLRNTSRQTSGGR